MKPQRHPDDGMSCDYEESPSDVLIPKSSNHQQVLP
jgi:hypothetical protein